ncbi:hypothetical protein ACSXC4_03590 [Clostridium perfringens]|uniref:Uncharacterized protein n=1 Tax=Clostridium perfringens TaxID=1502 RepID=A0A127EHL8_CLOPF|nr:MULTISPECIES: hypothetical protein [Clostridium]AMN35471.1 hypothetical protein JFP838_06815 [Clostridium perfringens]MDK7589859.1 hypothetical protein [Clostridium sp. UMB9555B]MDK7627747.1 hypothetical protein [Clostridium sp. UMB9555A]HAT4336782.1 hypothetical protein [Clostridium perfringens]
MENTKEESNSMLIILIITVIVFILFGLYFTECEKRITKENKIKSEIESEIITDNEAVITNNYLFEKEVFDYEK